MIMIYEYKLLSSYNHISILYSPILLPPQMEVNTLVHPKARENSNGATGVSMEYSISNNDCLHCYSVSNVAQRHFNLAFRHTNIPEYD